MAMDKNKIQRKMLILNSITYAYKAKDFLFQKGIRAYVERIPKNLRTSGCGYGVRVDGNAETAASLLEYIGIKVRGIIDLS